MKKVKTLNSLTMSKLNLDSIHTQNNNPDNYFNITVNNSNINYYKSSHNKLHLYTYKRHKSVIIQRGSFSLVLRRILFKSELNININENRTKHSMSVKKRSPALLWKKTLNVKKMVNAFLCPPVIKIDDSEIFTDSLRNTLLGSESKGVLTKSSETNNLSPGQFLQKSAVEKEFVRISIKERAHQLITEGSSKDDIIKEFEALFNRNPEKYRYNPNDKKYLFNLPLSDGKTILYIACQEGYDEIVEYLLSKDLNPNIRVYYNEMEDTCLWVACRWNYYNIVKLLLETKKILIKDIEKALEECPQNKKLISLLYHSLPEENKKKRRCACF